MPAAIFSQMRGTAKNSVGWTSLRFAWTVSIDSAKWTVTPAPALVHTVAARSATWHSGRYDSVTSLWEAGGSNRPPEKTSTSMPKLTLRLVSIAPFGGPVVPEV